MKRLLMVTLALLIMAACAAADTHGPYVIAPAEDIAVQSSESSTTYVRGNTRVVVLCISRIPDAAPADVLPLLMAQYDPAAVADDAPMLADGFYGTAAISADKFSVGVDQVTVMVLRDGELLILSGYDLDGDTARVRTLIDDLLGCTTANGTALVDPALLDQ